MANWAFIENQNIKEVLDELPKNWRNVSNLDALENNTDVLKNLGWYPVQHNHVDYDPYTQKLKSLSIKFDGTTVLETYGVEMLPTDILYNEFIIQLRIKRDKLLQESDFMCLYDLINIKGKDWADACVSYRQQLRDLPSLYPNDGTIYKLNNINWPIKPEMKNYPNKSTNNIGGTN